MNSDDHNPIDSEIRSAYQELSERATVAARSIAAGDGPSVGAGDGSPAMGQRFAPALLVAAVVALLAGGATLLALRNDGDQPVETGPAENDQIVADGDEVVDGKPTAGEGSSEDGDGEPNSSPSPSDPSIEDEPNNRVDGEVRAGDRYRVATALVAADVNDPFLNLRWSPDADAELLARLPPTYAGLEATGMSSEASDGGMWLHFKLLDPLQVNLGEPLHGGVPTGWANAAFVELLPSALPIGNDELPACAGDGSRGQPDRSGTAADDWYVYGLESSLLNERCLRVVVTFGQAAAPLGNWEDIDDEVGPASATPAAQVVSTGGFGVTVDLPGVRSAFAGATETDDSVFVVRRADQSLDLISPLPVRGAQLNTFPERGIAVIDLELDTSRDAPLSGGGVHLTREPMVGSGRVDLAGIARPFEASLDVRVLDESGAAVEAIFSGNRFLGTRRGTSYGASTNDWTEAWGAFALRIAGLDPGSYRIEFESIGGSEGGQPFTVPFRIDETGIDTARTPTLASDEEQSAALQLMAYAASGDFESVPLADEVTLLLGGVGGEQQVLSRAELGTPGAWTFEAEEAFGFVGPFNILNRLRSIGVQISAGPINHCAGPPVSWPVAVGGFRQVNIEPVGIDSCLSWFGVSLFLDGEGDIAAVALDLWEP